MPRHHYWQAQFHVVQLCRSHPVSSHQMAGYHTATARYSADQAGRPPSRAEHSHREAEDRQHANGHAGPQRPTTSNQNCLRQTNMDPTPATTHPAYSMPVGHHPNGPNTRANVHIYVPLLHMHTCNLKTPAAGPNPGSVLLLLASLPTQTFTSSRKTSATTGHIRSARCGGLRSISEMLRQDVGGVSEAWASSERLSYRNIFDDQLEWRRMHYNFYPCVRADSLTRIVVKHTMGSADSKHRQYFRAFVSHPRGLEPQGVEMHLLCTQLRTRSTEAPRGVTGFNI